MAGLRIRGIAHPHGFQMHFETTRFVKLDRLLQPRPTGDELLGPARLRAATCTVLLSRPLLLLHALEVNTNVRLKLIFV
jgi:hypothetical protein